MQRVAIDSVVVGEGRRALREDHVERLAVSIRELGLLNPITLTTGNRLVAGLHRLTACQRIGWTEIPVIYRKFSSLQAELAEIDENLERCELTALERGELLLRKKDLYEALHPETKKGGDMAKKSEQRANSHETKSPPSFAVAAAEKLGRDKATVLRDVQIARDLTDEAKRVVRDTPVANAPTKLIAIARMAPGEQVAAAAAAIEAAHTRRLRSVEPPDSPNDDEARPSTPPAAAPEIAEGVDVERSVALVLGPFAARARPFLELIRRAHAEAKELRKNIPVANEATAMQRGAELMGLMNRVLELAEAMTPEGVCPRCRGRKPFCTGSKWRCGGWVSAKKGGA